MVIIIITVIITVIIITNMIVIVMITCCSFFNMIMLWLFVFFISKYDYIMIMIPGAVEVYGNASTTLGFIAEDPRSSIILCLSTNIVFFHFA